MGVKQAPAGALFVKYSMLPFLHTRILASQNSGASLPFTPSLQEIEVRQSCREKANDVGLDHGADHGGLVLNWLVIQQLRPESLK